MNKYRVDIDVGINVFADSNEEAVKKAYDVIGNDLVSGSFEDYEVLGDPMLLDTKVENKCFNCGKADTGGSNDEMCPKCFKEWSDYYEKSKKEKDFSD